MTAPTTLPYALVDAFTDRPYTGNPAAVVLPGPDTDLSTLSDAALQTIAVEMNLSETAFPYPVDPDGGARRLRWFTPTTEVTLCGHATLAAAHALEESGTAEAPFHFDSLSGRLEVHREGDGRLRMDFPADPPFPMRAPPGLLEALGCPRDAPVVSGRRCVLVRLGDADVLRALAPDLRALGRIPLPKGVLGVSVTAPGLEAGVDFVSRFFGPWVGVDEDPVTGMAHTVLGPYWAAELNRTELTARQVSRRGGEVGIRLRGDRIDLLGHAVTIARGELRLP